MRNILIQFGEYMSTGYFIITIYFNMGFYGLKIADDNIFRKKLISGERIMRFWKFFVDMILHIPLHILTHRQPIINVWETWY